MRRRMGRGFGVLLLLFLPILPTGAFGADIYGGSTTISYAYQTHYDGESRDSLSLFEYANLHAENFGAPGLSLHFAGWGRYDALDRPEDPGLDGEEAEDARQPGDADLSHVYFQWVGLDGALSATAGRHFITAGVMAESLDGLDLVLEPVRGLRFMAFGGVPTFSRRGERDGDLGYGGRMSYGYRESFEVGASYAGFYEDEEWDRQNLGGDLYLAPWRYGDLIGHVFYDLLFDEVYDAAGILSFYPVTDMRLGAGYTRVVPQSYLGKMSYFSVFSAETIDKFEGELSYRLLNRVRFLGAYSHYEYEEADGADRYGGGLELFWGDSRENSLGGRYHKLDRKKEGYQELRGYFIQYFARKFHLALNTTTYYLDEKIYDVDATFDGDMSLGWQITNALSVQATGVFRSTPYYDSDVRALLKIGYNVERPL